MGGRGPEKAGGGLGDLLSLGVVVCAFGEPWNKGTSLRVRVEY